MPKTIPQTTLVVVTGGSPGPPVACEYALDRREGRA